MIAKELKQEGGMSRTTSIPTKTLDDCLDPSIVWISRNQAITIIGTSSASFDRTKEILNQLKPIGYRHVRGNRGCWRSTLEVIYQFQQLTKLFGTVEETISYLNKHLKELQEVKRSGREEKESNRANQKPADWQLATTDDLWK